jgi:hypothetical protein
MGYFPIDHSTSRTVATPVGIPLVLGEESNVMTFANNNDGDCGIDSQFFTSICTGTKNKAS